MKPYESFEQRSHTGMSGDAAIQLLQLFEQNGIAVCVDGGWGVDALLGEQTRSHADLDIALQHKDVLKLRGLLEVHDYKDVPLVGDLILFCLMSMHGLYNKVLNEKVDHVIDVNRYLLYAL